MYWTEGSFQSYLFIFILRLVISGLFFFFVSHVIFVVIVVVAVVFSFFWQMTWHIWATLFPLLDGIFFLRCYSSSLFISHPFFLFMLSEVFTVFSNNSSVFYVFGYFSFFRWHFVISQLAVLMTFPLNQRERNQKWLMKWQRPISPS